MDPRELERRPVRHRCVDHLAPARRPRVEDAGADAEGEHHPAATHVADQVERHDRIPVGRPDRSERPGESDVVDVVARLPGERAVLPPPRHAAVDEPRVAREARVRPEPEPLCDARSKPLDERVRPIDEPERQIHAFRGLEIDRHRAPATVQDGGEGLRARPGRAVDAHDLRAEIGQDHPAERPGPDPPELDHAQPGEGPKARVRGLRFVHPPPILTRHRRPGRAGLDSKQPLTRGEEAALLNESAVRCAP